jgi:tetratricopeptide (TPR) repeat protein
VSGKGSRSTAFQAIPAIFLFKDTAMHSARLATRQLLTVAALVLTAGLVWAAPTPDAEDAPQRKQALALNDVTGDEAMRGQVEELVRDAKGTKKLLPVALAMSKDKKQPFNYNAAYILSSTARKLKDVDTAKTFYRLAIDLATKLGSGTKMAQAYGGLSDMLYENKLYDENEKLCKEILELEDDGAQRAKFGALMRMVNVLAKQGKFDDAYKLIDNLSKGKPDYWLWQDLKAGVQREEGKFDEAAKTYESMIDSIKKDDGLKEKEKAEMVNEVRYLLSNVYLELKDIKKTGEYLEALLAEDPDNPTYNNDLGYIWADHDMNLEKSEKLIRKALEEDKKRQLKENPALKPEEVKDNAAYLDSLAWVLYKQKKYKEAKPPILEAVKDKEQGQHVEILDHLGDIHMALGEKDEAVAAWKKALEANSETKRDKQRKTEIEKKLKMQEK